MTSKTLSQTVDFLGFLRGQLSGLQGISTMCYELIQNADDVKDEQGNPATTRITFDFRDDALWVENDGVFREIDFERMRRISWGDKSKEPDTTGAFGIGFISVYQITDAPEIFSSGRHWVFHPEAPESKRIVEERIETQLTRFRLPWAFEASTVRQELGVPPVPSKAIDGFAQEAARAVEEAALFLRQLEVLEVKRNGNLLLKRVELLREDNRFILGTGKDAKIWHVLQGNFSAEAEQMQRHYGNLLENRKTQVQIAIPEEPSDAGRLYAFLPSETLTGLPFHINADFFPSPDRKRILLDQDYKSEWNRLALRCAVKTLRRDAAELLSLFDDRRRLWAFLECVKMADENGPLAVKELKFWEAVAQSLADKPIILTSRGENLAPAQVRYPRQEDQAKAAAIFEELGLPIVHQDLRRYQNLLTDRMIGVPLLDLEAVVTCLEQAGLRGRRELDSFPSSLRTREQWRVFWDALDSLQRGAQTEIRQRLSQCAIAFGSDGALHPPSALFHPKEENIQALFSSIDPDIVWFDPEGKEDGIPGDLVTEFGLEEGLKVLEQSADKLPDLLGTGQVQPSDFYEWLDAHRKKIKDSPSLRERILALPIGPTADGTFRPLRDLYLAGGFDDPLGMATMLDMTRLSGRRDLLQHDIGVKVLDLTTYVAEWIPRVWKDASIGKDERIALVRFLSENLSKIKVTHDHKLKPPLQQLPLVLCHDSVFQRADKAYFGGPEIQHILGNRIPIVDESLLAENEAIRDFYLWLGVAKELRAQDVMDLIRELTSSPPDENRRQQVKDVFAHLAREWKNWDDERKQAFDALKRLPWLPGSKDRTRWFKPNELYAVFQDYLFASQGNFLAFARPVQIQGSDFLSYLGVHSQPTTDLVVKHLLHCAEEGESVNEQVYRFLTENVDELEATQIDRVRDSACLYVTTKDGEQRYLKPSQAFFGEHNFGRYRVSLPHEFSAYRRFLEVIGVKDKPDASDVIAVLQEIARTDLALGNRSVRDKPEFDIVVDAWRFLSRALEEGKITPDDLRSELGAVKSIPNSTQGILCEPGVLFLEDRPGWVQKFKLIEHNIVDRIEGCWPAMESAGVRRLSQAVIVDLAEYRPASTAPIDVAQRLHEREHLLRRVLAARDGRLREADRQALERLLAVEFHPADILKVKRTIEVFKQIDECLDDERALWLQDTNDRTNHLYFTITDGQPSWVSIARELAYAVGESDSDQNLAMYLKEVLTGSTPEEVERTFDELGVLRLEEHESNRIMGHEAVSLGAPVPQTSTEENLVHDGANASSAAQVPDSIPASVSQSTSTRSMDWHKADTTRRTTQASQRREPHRSTSRLVSYVEPQRNSNEDDRSLQSAKSRLQEIGEKGVELVLKYEREQGREPEDMNKEIPNHPGYDVKSFDPATGETRYIEVKALTGNWDATNPARMTLAEFEAAQERREKFWLYVIEQVESTDPRIYCICNPAGKVTYFCFDHGWVELAERWVELAEQG